MITRRDFLTTSLGALSASALPAMEPIKRAGKPHMMLGVAGYSFRNYFQWMRDKEQKPKDGRKPWSILDFVDWCADNNVPGAEVTSYFFPPDCNEDFCLKLRHHAFMRGVQLSGGAVGNNFALPKGPKLDEQIAYTKKWIDFSAIMNVPHIRVFAGVPPKGMPVDEAIKNCIEAYQVVLDYAATKGVVLGLENHGGIVAEPDTLLHIMKSVNSEWAGINLDSGNFITEDPYADLAKIAPYAVNVQVKADIRRKGAAADELSDIGRVAQILKDANYQGWFTLEYERNDDPFVSVPKVLDEMRKHLI